MRKDFKLLLLLLMAIVSCSPRNGTPGRTPIPEPAPSRISTLVEPGEPLTVAVGDEIGIVLAYPDTVSVDSFRLFLDGELRATFRGELPRDDRGNLIASLKTEDQSTGNAGLRIKLFFAGSKTENQSQQITFLSDLVPEQFSYRVVNEFEHDPTAYTQGLEFVDGWVYEGTGNYGTSSIRKETLETGEVNMIRNLDQSLFGEGITVFGDRIYQLTYKSQVGFIYDKKTFEEIQKVYYQNREGWGLTNNGEELIMSDGTHVIYFLDPELFTVNRQIEVYDDRGRAERLNELEYINGRIWANRYYTDEIVIIDPATGKVEGRINLKGILKTEDREPNTDVLNGIAWDRDNKRIFVTGKFWPKLFEIKLVSNSFS